MTKPNGRRNVAVKVEQGTHDQLGVLAKLDGKQIPDVIRQAITEYLDRKRTELAERADEVVAEIEREAAAKKSAMQSLFGTTEPAAKLEVVDGQTKRAAKSSVR